MNVLRPIEIVGGGLAGLSLGFALRRANVPVTIIEAGTYPRHRVCGEFITGLTASTRARLDLDPILAEAVINREVAWFSGDRVVRRQQLPSPALSVSRYVLDARLADAFASAGGDLRAGVRSDVTGDAPGRIFANGRRRGPSSWLGLKVHATELPLEPDLELHLGDGAYVGLARIEHGRVNICGLFRKRTLNGKGAELIARYAEATGLPALASRLRAAAVDDASFCAVAGVVFDRRVPASDEVRLGDACAMIPPFTGHGMAMAFRSAELSLDPLIAFARGECDWSRTRRTIQVSLRKNFRLRLASAAALHSFLHQPVRQRWLAALNRAHLLPFRPLYAVLH